jgi:EAL domain-containing protein (putative c-di-GMP-specific phosphodiesterase class I)
MRDERKEAVRVQSDVDGGPIAMAFQPVVDIRRGEVFAYKALARRPGGTSAAEVFRGVFGCNLARLERCLVQEALKSAAALGIRTRLAINLGGTMLGDLAELASLSEMVARAGLSADRIIFELPERLPIEPSSWRATHQTLRSAGFSSAIDDFGAGHAGLSVLALYSPHLLKLDIGLTRGVLSDVPRQIIVSGIVGMATRLGVEVAAEGVEMLEDAVCLRRIGISLQQGYFYARPELEQLRKPDLTLLLEDVSQNAIDTAREVTAG